MALVSEISQLRRDYGDFLIDIPRWTIPDRGITALFGPSGAGKTSVFRLLIGLEPCPGLRWVLNGENLAALPTPERRLGVVFQNAELFPHLTAEQNMLFAARARGVPTDEARARLDAFATELSLGRILNRPAGLLSGGEAQRVALARALIGRPRFLFLDEPFSALDEDLRHDARRMVGEVIAKAGVPTLLISHDREDLATLADTRVGIANGRLVGAVPPP